MLTIAHAGGALAGRAYTNSLEALDASYAAGWRWFELDFKRTADGAIACRHDWQGFAAPPTLAELRAAFAGSFTPAEAESLAAWMEAHEDAVLVTDVKEDDQVPVLRDLLAAGVPARRTVVQLFDPSEDGPVADLGFGRRSIILYRYGGTREALTSFLARGPVAVGVSQAQAASGLLGELPPVPAWVYTVNGAGEAAALRAADVAGVFSDALAPGGDLSAEPRHRLFVYGTLRDRAVQRAVFGREVRGETDALPGYEKGLLACRDESAVATSGIVHHPVVRRAEGGAVEGEVLLLTEADLLAADAYEDLDYARVPIRLASGGGAWLYVAAGDA